MAGVLNKLLYGRCSPECADMLAELSGTLLKVGFTMHDEELDYLYNMVDSVEGASVVPSVEWILRSGGDTLLKQYGILVDGEIPVPLLTALVRSVGTFSVGDNAEVLSAIVESEQDPVDVLADVLQQLCQFTPEDFLPWLLEVKPALIEEIRSQVESFQELNDTPVSIDEAIANRVNWFHTQEENILSAKARDEGVPLGLDMEQLFAKFDAELADMSMEQAVPNLLSLTLMSNVSLEAIEDETMFFLNDLYPDLETSTKASRLLKQEMSKVGTYIAMESNKNAKA